MSNGQGIPPAWYPDPADARKMRYWDGAGWTQNVVDAAPPTQAIPPSAPLIPVAAPSTVSFDHFTGYEHSSRTGAGYVPLSRGALNADRLAAPPRESSATIASWLGVLVPLLLLAHQPFSWEFDPQELTNMLIHGAIALGTVIVALLFAAIDRNQLVKRGYAAAPPAIVALIPPIHSLARLFGVGVGGLLVALAGLLVQATVGWLLFVQYSPEPVDEAPIFAPVVTEGMEAPFTEQQLTFLLTPEGMALKLRYDAAQSDMEYQTITCEPLGSTELGATTMCSATGRLVDYAIEVTVMPDGENTPFVATSIQPILR